MNIVLIVQGVGLDKIVNVFLYGSMFKINNVVIFEIVIILVGNILCINNLNIILIVIKVIIVCWVCVNLKKFMQFLGFIFFKYFVSVIFG